LEASVGPGEGSVERVPAGHHWIKGPLKFHANQPRQEAWILMAGSIQIRKSFPDSFPPDPFFAAGLGGACGNSKDFQKSHTKDLHALICNA
jgi:hypothetical protein